MASPLPIFTLQSAVQIAPATIRVTFSIAPLAVNSNNATDALNPLNYVVTGPVANPVTNAGTVFGNPIAIDLFLSNPLAVGTWNVSVNNVAAIDQVTIIQTPNLIQFTSIASIQELPSMGTQNDDEEQLLRKFLNPALVGIGWDSVIAGIAVGEAANNLNASLAFDQLFTTSASGIYLKQRASDVGLTEPLNVGMTDDVFRKYVITLTNNKINENSLLELLEIFYGSESVRAFNDSALTEPFAFQNGDELDILLDEQVSVHIVFTTDDFAEINNAQAIEVAAAITRGLGFAGTDAYSVIQQDPTTGLNHVRIYSGALGLKSAVRITGGEAQNRLYFSENLPLTSGLPTWNITYDVTTGITRFTCGTGVDLSGLQIGDYVNIYGSVFHPENRGSFPVTNVAYSYPLGVLTQYFEIANPGFAEVVIQASSNDILYFRPIKKTTYTTMNREVIVAVAGDGGVDIVLPATSAAVTRQELTGAYLHDNPSIDIVSLTSINGVATAVVATPDGMSVGSQFTIDGAMSTPAVPSTTTGTYVAGSGTSDYSVGSIWSQTAGTTKPVAAMGGIAVSLLNERVFYAHGYSLASSVRSDTTFWNVLSSTSTTLTNGSKQLTFADIGFGTNPTNVSFPGASLGDTASWFYGQVMVTGGQNNALNAVNTVNLYTPTTLASSGIYAAFTKTLNTARWGHGQVTLNSPGHAFNGGFLVVGGLTAVGTPTATVERYSPVEGLSGTWTNMASMATARAFAPVITLQNGNVLVVGGQLLSTCELYNPITNTWSYTGNMTYARSQHKAILLPDGRVLVAGGVGYNPTQSTTPVELKAMEIYDPNTGRWSPAGYTNYNHDYPILQLLPTLNQVIIAGGDDAVDGLKTEILDLSTFKITTASAVLPALRPGAVSALIGTEDIALIGGYNPSTNTSDSFLELYIPNANAFYSNSFNGTFSVASIISPTSFTFNVPYLQYFNNSSSAVITPSAAMASDFPGPITFDPTNGVSWTGTKAVLQQPLNESQHYGSIILDDATKIPDAPGWLVFAFGYENQVAPVKYLGRLSNTELSIDYGFKFPVTVLAGSNVNLLYQKGPFVPPNPTELGSFYLTDSSSGRIAAANAVGDALAAGVIVNEIVVYPGDRGLSNEGAATSNSNRINGVVEIWGSNDIDQDVATARGKYGNT